MNSDAPSVFGASKIAPTWSSVTASLSHELLHFIREYVHSHMYCNVDGQRIAKQRLSKHVKTHATVEVQMLIANYWATSSVPINSLTRNQVLCSYADSAVIVAMQ
jgi:hypothetical protein